MRNIAPRLYTYLFLAFISVIVIVFLASCITQNRRDRICATCQLKETITDSTGTPVVHATPFDTALWIINHQGKEMNFKDCPELDRQLVSQGTITAVQNGIRETITRTAKGITFKCETDSLKQIIRLLRIQISTPHYRVVIRDVPAHCTLNHRTGFDDLCRWVFWILCGAASSGIGLWLIKRRL